jgi:hypothetical protein
VRVEIGFQVERPVVAEHISHKSTSAIGAMTTCGESMIEGLRISPRSMPR